MSTIEFGEVQTAPSMLARWRPWLTVLAGVVALAIVGAIVRYIVFVVTAHGSGVQPFMDALCVWDCAWYKTIVEGGYDLRPAMRLRPGAANWAFFPLLPLTAAALRAITQLPTTTIGFIISNAFIITTAMVCRPLFNGNTRAYWLVVVMLMIGPFSFLFNTLYTESLFILLTVLVLVMLQRGNYLAAGGYGALLSATRVTGVLIVFSIFVQALQDHLKAGGRWRDFPRRVLTDSRLLLALVITPLGLFAYMTFLYLYTGDALAFAHIQRAWGRDLANPFSILWDSLTVQWPLSPDGMIVVTWAVGSVIGLLLSVLLIVRGRWAAAVFCALTIVMSLAGGIISMIRYIAGLFPLGMALCETLAASRVTFALAVILAVVSDVVLMTGWLRSSLFVM